MRILFRIAWIDQQRHQKYERQRYPGSSYQSLRTQRLIQKTLDRERRFSRAKRWFVHEIASNYVPDPKTEQQIRCRILPNGVTFYVINKRRQSASSVLFRTYTGTVSN